MPSILTLRKVISTSGKLVVNLGRLVLWDPVDHGTPIRIPIPLIRGSHKSKPPGPKPPTQNHELIIRENPSTINPSTITVASNLFSINLESTPPPKKKKVTFSLKLHSCQGMGFSTNQPKSWDIPWMSGCCSTTPPTDWIGKIICHLLTAHECSSQVAVCLD